MNGAMDLWGCPLGWGKDTVEVYGVHYCEAVVDFGKEVKLGVHEYGQ